MLGCCSRPVFCFLVRCARSLSWCAICCTAGKCRPRPAPRAAVRSRDRNHSPAATRNYIGVGTAEAAKGQHFDAIVRQESYQAFVLIFGKRRRHHDALETEGTAAPHHRRQHGRSRNRCDRLDQIENFQIGARSFKGKKQLTGDHEKVQRRARSRTRSANASSAR
jgi:hypothetical protein